MREMILASIPLGRKNAVSMTKLANVCGIEERELREAVLKCRIDGTVICSSAEGYFYPANTEEAKEYYKRKYGAIMTGLKSLKATRKRLQEEGVDVAHELEGRKKIGKG